MLRFYVAIAGRLHRARAVVWLIATLSVAGFGATLFLSEAQADEAYMLACVAVLLWAICLLVVVYTFNQPLPEIEPQDRFLLRVRKRLSLGMRWVMAWTMTLLCLSVIYVSFRAGSIALQNLGV